ncbi:uncharacterized protein IL334_001086 [Kwoniella shivajii]|uniref:Uncharacterized protein n=1 Tax=Kwoniella shivajii TaxID=564305 RepID=A0ABZ1CS18_9TREE|nr:hypothetical protein IL334_001086 [Kwoniella shivajii]
MLATQHQYIHSTNDKINNAPGWDDKIVPTLKKRLESESIYLTNRLSATQFEENTSSPSIATSQINTFPLTPTFGIFPLSQTQHPSSSHTHTSNIDDRGRQPSSNPTQIISSSSSSSTHSPSTDAVRSKPIPSRIPTRPRSKSQISTRPSVFHSNSHPPPLPLPPAGTGIPILETRSRSPSKRYNIPSSSSSSRMASTILEDNVRKERESFDLNMGERIREGFIKNELPPFRMNPNEALRIAEKGHIIHQNDWNKSSSSSSSNRPSYNANTGNDDDQVGDGGQGEKRKRAITMKTNGNGNGNNTNTNLLPRSRIPMERSGSSGSDRSSTRRNSRPSTSSAIASTSTSTSATNDKGYGYGYGMSASQTGLGLGMGHPNSMNTSRLSNGKPSQRSGSASSRSPINGSPSLSFNAPRSASMNILSNSPSMIGNAHGHSHGTPPNSRLGVAAHFIPPESTYTPPKGADWDEVVLPTVAKKLGITDQEKKEGADIKTEEEDLAVEWDKDGTPIRWVKRKGLPKGLGESIGSQDPSRPDNSTPTRTHAFSPTFEPSPDNPLHPRPRPSHSSSSLRRKPSGDAVELGSIRTTNGPSSTLNQGDSHPTTFPTNISNTYYPGGEPFSHPQSHRKTSSQNLSLSNGFGSGSGSNPNLNRKPSTLKKQPTPSVSRQTSELSLKNNRNRVPSNSNNNNGNGNGNGNGSLNMRGNVFAPPGQNLNPLTNQSGTPGTTHRITDAIYENQMARRDGRVNEKSNKKKDGGSHGKGCGCLIM